MQRQHLLLLALALLIGPAYAQELPLSGTAGVDLVYATSPGGTSRLYAVTLSPTPAAVPIGAAVQAVPSRWAHRRRTLGALETAMVVLEQGLVMTPMGDAPGNGAIHLVDVRGGTLTSTLIPTGNPAGYDLAVSEPLQYVFSAEDDGSGNTLLRGFSWSTPGTLTPLNPPTITLPGGPCTGVNRMGMDPLGVRLHVPTTQGVHVVDLSPSAPQMTLGISVLSGTAVPVTNPTSFNRNGTLTWIVGTSTFDATGFPVEAGFFSWTQSGASESGVFGIIPNLSPPRSYVPAVGCTELAVVGDGTDTWAYFLLRDPSPTALYIRPSAIGVARFLGSSPVVAATIPYPAEGGEPFAIPTVSGTRVAIESSQGPPFSTTPPDGGEPVSILYTPLDPLGAGTQDGLLVVPSPLGGRISTKGMDRPLWSRDGTRVVACTSHFPGAPNPGTPGIEVLNVPASVPLNFYNSPHYVVPNFTSPYRSIIFPSSFQPNDPAAAAFLDGVSFVGNVFHNGAASILMAPFGEIGVFDVRSTPFVQSPDIPNFPALLPPTPDDPNGSLVPVPPSFGARRTTWNLYPQMGLVGLVMSAAVDDRILVQPAGLDFLIELGLVPGAQRPAPFEIPLPSGWITTTEFRSL